MDPQELESRKQNTMNLLLNEARKVPAFSNWGILALKNGVLVFSEKASHYQSLVDENGHFDFYNLKKIPFREIVPEPKYIAIPVFRTILTGEPTDDQQVDTVWANISKLKYWGNTNVQSFGSYDMSELQFATSIMYYSIDQDVFSSLSNR